MHSLFWDITLAAVGSTIPVPPKAVDEPLLLAIEAAAESAREGDHSALVTGTIETGRVRVGDPIEIVGFATVPLPATVAAVMISGARTDSAQAGDTVGLLLHGIEKIDIRRGMVIAAPGSVVPTTHFRASVYILEKSEGDGIGPSPIAIARRSKCVRPT
jgi:elongation factor Tu